MSYNKIAPNLPTHTNIKFRFDANQSGPKYIETELRDIVNRLYDDIKVESNKPEWKCLDCMKTIIAKYNELETFIYKYTTLERSEQIIMFHIRALQHLQPELDRCKQKVEIQILDMRGNPSAKLPMFRIAPDMQ